MMEWGARWMDARFTCKRSKDTYFMCFLFVGVASGSNWVLALPCPFVLAAAARSRCSSFSTIDQDI